MRRSILTLVLTLALLASSSATALSAPTIRAATDPPLTIPQPTLAAAFGCTNPRFPNASTHEPVLLVHGTFANADENWGSTYRVALPRDGFDVCWVTLPDRALDDIQVSSEYVVYAVHQMYGADGGRPVAMIGHSQGGLEVRWALRWWPSVQAEVADAITLASPNHGTTVAQPYNQCFPSCWQMTPRAHFIAALNSGTETPGSRTPGSPVSYTALFSDFDTLVLPELPESTAAINGPGAANIRIQDLCAARPVDHVAFAYDGVVYALVLDALTHAGPADPARTMAKAGGQLALCRAFDLGNLNAAASVFSRDLSRGGGFPTTPWVASEPPLAPYARP